MSVEGLAGQWLVVRSAGMASKAESCWLLGCSLAVAIPYLFVCFLYISRMNGE